MGARKPTGFMLSSIYVSVWLSCLNPWILSIMFRPFGFLAKSGSKKTKEPKQDRQNLGASKPKGLNRIAKIWELEKRRT
jgi:hypothetical protein